MKTTKTTQTTTTTNQAKTPTQSNNLKNIAQQSKLTEIKDTLDVKTTIKPAENQTSKNETKIPEKQIKTSSAETITLAACLLTIIYFNSLFE